MSARVIQGLSVSYPQPPGLGAHDSDLLFLRLIEDVYSL